MRRATRGFSGVLLGEGWAAARKAPRPRSSRPTRSNSSSTPTHPGLDMTGACRSVSTIGSVHVQSRAWEYSMQ
ncbi:hypothetical protein ACWGLP_04100 [Streptomyces lydicus]